LSPFSFVTDHDGEAFCVSIAAEMERLFEISRPEAIGRINRHWAGQTISGPDDLVYREDESFWAKAIYYTSDSNWWIPGSTLCVKPYPLLRSLWSF
jgi:hypothetical protein